MLTGNDAGLQADSSWCKWVVSTFSLGNSGREAQALLWVWRCRGVLQSVFRPSSLPRSPLGAQTERHFMAQDGHSRYTLEFTIRCADARDPNQ
jgi:hypothetical protein